MGSKLSLTFRIFKQGQLVRIEKLTQGVIKLGKVPSAHLQLEDESVSRMHAIIEVTGDTVSLIDLGSTRGTFVNGQRINKATLRTGDAIMVGDIRVELAIEAAQAEAPAVVAAPAPTPAPVVAARPVPPPMPIHTMTMPAPAPAPRALVAPAPAAPSFGASDEDLGGARAVEVATMLGDSVVDVKHCMNPKGGKVTMKTWGFFAAGLACLLTSGIAFASSVSTAATNKAAHDYHTQVLKRPAHAFRPTPVPIALDFLMFGGFGLGLLGMTAGLVGWRNDRKSPYYRVGTAPGVEQPLETAPSPEFPLVAPSGDDFVFNYGPGIDGEMIVDGTSTPLAELAATGRARPSATTAGAIEVPIPPKARIRARSGNTTFLVSAVAKPRAQAVPLFAALERRHVAYIAGSLAVHMGIWAFLQTVPTEAMGANVELTSGEATDIRAATTEKEMTPPEELDDADAGNDGGKEGMGAKMALDEGAAGTTKSDRLDGHMRIKNNNKEPNLSKAEAIEEARRYGILGSTFLREDSIGAIASEGDYSSGFDDVNVYGPLFGSEGEGKGVFGGGVRGFGPGGGCGMPPCGIIGTGRYGTIGTGDRAGDGWGGPGNGHGGMRRRTPFNPTGYIGRPTTVGDLDKEIIRRYIKRNITKIAYCYEKELLAKPNLGGTVSVSFLIAPNGSVQSAAGTGVDGEVAGCVASVIKTISFPAPTNGGTVQVNYPFNFHRAGQ